MNRQLVFITLLLLSPPVLAHDFTWVLYGEGIAFASFGYSVYLIGKGNRISWSLILILLWALLWLSLYFTGNLLPLAVGGLVLIIAQPIVAATYRKRHSD